MHNAVMYCGTVIGSFVTGPHTEMGSSCQYRVPGVNSDTQMDVFRILRVAFLKSTSGGASAAPSDAAANYLPLNYEIFVPEQVRQAASTRPSLREPSEKMRDTFAKVTTYLRNSGNKIVHMQCTQVESLIASECFVTGLESLTKSVGHAELKKNLNFIQQSWLQGRHSECLRNSRP